MQESRHACGKLGVSPHPACGLGGLGGWGGWGGLGGFCTGAAGAWREPSMDPEKGIKGPKPIEAMFGWCSEGFTQGNIPSEERNIAPTKEMVY